MDMDPQGAARSGTDRAAFAGRLRAALEECCPASRTELAGSLGAGTADAFSDIDILWLVPDARFPDCLAEAEAVAALGRVQPVESVRSDPDFHHSDRRRLLFVRFAGVSLFWRLDLEVRTASVADDPDYDVGNPAARARDDEWSRPASALANALGVVKAVARGRDEEARGLLARGFARIGDPDRATGAWVADVTRLARSAARHDPALSDLATRVAALAARQLGEGTPEQPVRWRRW
ncbi:hypothetical protein [Streptomyces sp. NPDC021356]|uniref:hypothetical protein n=1 Tax=Streptomyces sp. NPDC021356 TaxID=3154900 RepID=UPI0033DFF998